MARKKANSETINCALYIRVSSKGQVEDGYSLEYQERQLRSYCVRHGFKIFKLYKDKGISGKLIKKRPGIIQLLEDIKAGKSIDKLITLKLSRATRNTKEMLMMIEEFRKHHVDFVCVEDNIDIAAGESNANSNMTTTILSSINQFESDIARERTLAAKEELSLQKKFAGGRIAFGYSYNKDNKIFSIDHKEASVVKYIFNSYIDGDSAYKIAKNLNNQNCKTRLGAVWRTKKILDILKNEFYIGSISWNGIVNKNHHDKLISKQIFNKAQSKIMKNEKSPVY